MEYSEYSSEGRPQIQIWQIGAALAGLAVVFSLGLAIGGEIGSFMLAGLNTLPFALLALLAYLGERFTLAKIAALLWLGLLVAGAGLAALGLSLQALADGLLLRPDGTFGLVAGAGPRLAAITLGCGVAVVLAALGFLRPVRRALSRVIPLDPDSFVQMVALVAVVALTLISALPLIALGAPPLLTIIAANDTGLDLAAGRGEGGLLRDLVYGLVWIIPGTIIAVGYGVRRRIGAALERVGLVRPSGRQVLLGLGVAVGLVIAVQFVSAAIDWLWGAMGWPQTDAEAFERLLAFAINPLGALVIGITAGLGEELAVRGVLQPRLGILLSNLFFTSLHAFQYSWDALLVVFLVGVVCGVVRKYTNTTTSAIVHGTYNFLLVMLVVLNIPGLGQ